MFSSIANTTSVFKLLSILNLVLSLSLITTVHSKNSAPAKLCMLLYSNSNSDLEYFLTTDTNELFRNVHLFGQSTQQQVSGSSGHGDDFRLTIFRDRNNRFGNAAHEKKYYNSMSNQMLSDMVIKPPDHFEQSVLPCTGGINTTSDEGQQTDNILDLAAASTHEPVFVRYVFDHGRFDAGEKQRLCYTIPTFADGDGNAPLHDTLGTVAQGNTENMDSSLNVESFIAYVRESVCDDSTADVYINSGNNHIQPVRPPIQNNAYFDADFYFMLFTGKGMGRHGYGGDVAITSSVDGEQTRRSLNIETDSSDSTQRSLYISNVELSFAFTKGFSTEVSVTHAQKFGESVPVFSEHLGGNVTDGSYVKYSIPRDKLILGFEASSMADMAALSHYSKVAKYIFASETSTPAVGWDLSKIVWNSTLGKDLPPGYSPSTDFAWNGTADFGTDATMSFHEVLAATALTDEGNISKNYIASRLPPVLDQLSKSILNGAKTHSSSVPNSLGFFDADRYQEFEFHLNNLLRFMTERLLPGGTGAFNDVWLHRALLQARNAADEFTRSTEALKGGASSSTILENVFLQADVGGILKHLKNICFSASSESSGSLDSSAMDSLLKFAKDPAMLSDAGYLVDSAQPHRLFAHLLYNTVNAFSRIFPALKQEGSNTDYSDISSGTTMSGDSFKSTYDVGHDISNAASSIESRLGANRVRPKRCDQIVEDADTGQCSYSHSNFESTGMLKLNQLLSHLVCAFPAPECPVLGSILRRV